MAGQTLERKGPHRIIRASVEHAETLKLPSPDEAIFTLVILRTGTVTAKIRQTLCYIKAPAVICINERQEIQVLHEEHAAYSIVYFDPVFININMTIHALRSNMSENFIDSFGFFHLSPFLMEDPEKLYISLSDETCETIESYFLSLQNELDAQSDWYWSCRARSYFMDIINVLERIYHNYYVQDSTSRCSTRPISDELHGILSYINNHLDADIRLDDICERFMMSRNRVERLFHKYLNLTFYDYIKSQKLDRICYYLRFTELRAKEICPRVGFSSSQNLCKFFKAMTGTTPNAYRLEEITRRRQLIPLIRQADQPGQDRTVGVEALSENA